MDTEKLSRSQSEKYLVLARDFFRKKANVDRQVAVGQTLEEYDFVFRKSIEANQLRTALAALVEKCRLLDLSSSVIPFYKEEDREPKGPSVMVQLFEKLDSVQGERLVRAFERMDFAFKSLGPDEGNARKAIADLSANALRAASHPVTPSRPESDPSPTAGVQAETLAADRSRLT